MNAIFFQMLPLFVFLIVDMIFTNTAVSITSAVLFAIFQMLFTYQRDGSPDYLILFDVGLIVVLGVLSIILKNDLFFKLKPAIIEVLMVALIIGFTFAPDSFIIKYLTRFTPKSMTLSEALLPQIKQMCWAMAIYTLLHAGAVWYTAYHSSRKVWAVVSGPGYFLLFIPIMVALFLRKSVFRSRQKTFYSQKGVPEFEGGYLEVSLPNQDDT